MNRDHGVGLQRTDRLLPITGLRVLRLFSQQANAEHHNVGLQPFKLPLAGPRGSRHRDLAVRMLDVQREHFAALIARKTGWGLHWRVNIAHHRVMHVRVWTNVGRAPERHGELAELLRSPVARYHD